MRLFPGETRRTVRLKDGTEIYCSIIDAKTPAPGRPALFLVNGSAFNFHQWHHLLGKGFLPLLGRHFRIVRYDYEGTGLSSPLKGKWNIERLGATLGMLADALGCGRAHFYAESQGTIVMQSLALQRPEIPLSLAGWGWVNGGASRSGGTLEGFRRRMDKFLEFGELTDAPLDRAAFNRHWGRVYRRLIIRREDNRVGLLDRIKEPFLKHFLYPLIVPTPVRVIYEWFDYAIGGMVDDIRGYNERLKKLTGVPVLIQHAANDQTLNVLFAREMHDALPWSEYIEYEKGYGHTSVNLVGRQARRVISDYRDFLAKKGFLRPGS